MGVRQILLRVFQRRGERFSLSLGRGSRGEGGRSIHWKNKKGRPLLAALNCSDKRLKTGSIDTDQLVLLKI
jgi:hypothetical protein